MNNKFKDENHMKIKFNLDNDLPLKKTLDFCNMIRVVKVFFHEDNKYFPQVLLDDLFYKL